MREILDSEFSAMIKKNIQPFQELMALYRCAIMEVETKLKVLDQEFSLEYDRNPIETIKTRLKTPEGIVKKLKKHNLPFSLDSIENNIHDIAGVRVICSFPQDIYLLADCLLRQDDVTLIEKKDYIKNPKESGYRSLHLIIEIPIFLLKKKRMMKANKVNAEKAIIIGSEELAAGNVTVKNLDNGEQRMVSLNNLIEGLK